MLEIKIPPIEYFDETCNEFKTSKAYSLLLEHSLVSLSKWEAEWKKPFLSKDTKTEQETLSYIKCMMVTKNISDDFYNYIPTYVIQKVQTYIEDSQTATTITNPKDKKSREIITSEIIYYWMVSLNIPFECQKWHLNRLLTLISVCNIKNSPNKKMNKKELASKNMAMNAARKRQLNTKG